MGNCLAGESCPFSHDPASLIRNMNLNDHQSSNSQQFQLENEAFPALPGNNNDQWSGSRKYPSHMSPGMRRNGGSSSRPHSRPTSRHQQRDSPLSVDDPEAFPSLSTGAKGGKKHHGKRGGHSREAGPSSLADVVRMSPSPVPGKGRPSKPSRETTVKTREMSAAAMAIPAPKHIPWLETGPRANQQYLKYRAEAIRHGTVRNKFLQRYFPGSFQCRMLYTDRSSAAQAWNRNDARAAKALSLRGQAENEAMRKCHREAARQLYEERNKHLMSQGLNDADEELYVDLHGLHPDEAVEYLEKILRKHAREDRIVYVITGTGHHSKNGKDKVGKAVKAWLNEWKYTFREFSVPGERGGYVGGVLGVDPTSYDKSMARRAETEGEIDGQEPNNAPSQTSTKIQLLKREEVEGKD